MKFSYNWLNTFVNIKDLDINDIKERLSESLAEVEEIETVNEVYENILICKVISIEKHPNADKLCIVNVDLGKKFKQSKELNETKENVKADQQVASIKNKNTNIKQVVTGASNFKVNDFLAYIPVGIKVPYNAYPQKSDGVIKKVSLRGIESQGMLASAKELNLANDHNGLMILNEYINENSQVKIGDSLAKLFNIQKDYIFSIENKALTHRGDCFSIIGIAREISALYNKNLDLTVLDNCKKLESDLQNKFKKQFELNKNSTKEQNKSPFSVKIRSTNSCFRYTGLFLENIKVEESPLWLKILLKKYNISCINNIVDFSNLIMLELGQPLHVFDYDKLVNLVGDNPQIIIRKALNGESINTLDHKNHKLNEETTLITAEGSKTTNNIPIAIAGIIGGQDTAVDENTKNILIEAANFDRFNIRKSIMFYGLQTDAATVFSRYQDPNKTLISILRYVEYINCLDKIQIQNLLDDYPQVKEEFEISININKAKEFIGISELPISKVESILTKLELKPKVNQNIITATIPTFRDDLHLEEDIYEQIVKLIGYKSIGYDLPVKNILPVKVNPVWEFKNLVSKNLVKNGLYEIMNFNFISANLYKSLNLEIKDCFRITNAVSPDVQYVKSLVLPSLILKTTENLRYYDYFGLFEFSKIYRKSLFWKDINTPLTKEVSNIDNSKTSAQNQFYYPENTYKDPDNLPVSDEHLAFIITDKTKKQDNKPVSKEGEKTIDNNMSNSYYLGKKYIDDLCQKINLKIEYKNIRELEKYKQDGLYIPNWILDLQNIYDLSKTAFIFTQDLNEKELKSESNKVKVIGIVGQLSNMVLKKLDLPYYTVASEIALYPLINCSNIKPSYTEISKYPFVEQDLCFVLNIDVNYVDIINAINNLKENLIRKITPIDIYENNNLQELLDKAKDSQTCKKQVTLRFTLQSYEKTLEEKEIKSVKDKVIKVMKKQFNAVLK